MHLTNSFSSHSVSIRTVPSLMYFKNVISEPKSDFFSLNNRIYLSRVENKGIEKETRTTKVAGQNQKDSGQHISNIAFTMIYISCQTNIKITIHML